jgi:asparagine synthase (glutamine-hydrolysing)
MCGLAGIIGEDNPDVMARMMRIMQHRGPDDSGSHRLVAGHLGVVTLGHLRLSIIDLSPNGRQPMANDDESLWIVFNGEIYNYLEIRAELERLGHRFRTGTDTEVILRAYEQWGADSVSRLNGMFAYAIVDIRRSMAILVRDRLGIKPLYYTVAQDSLVFASELKALLQHPGVRTDLDTTSLDRFLTVGYVPGEATMFRGISKLQPGTILRFERGRPLQFSEYWRIPDHRPSPLGHEELVSRFRELFVDAVRLQLVSDVPLGAFLSGGLDSSTVVAVMAKELGVANLNTFCVGFDGERTRHDERAHAAELSGWLGTRHHESECTAAEALDSLPSIAWHMDEPSSEDVVVPYLNLCRNARKTVTVVLTGEGSDEFLYGYRYYALERMRQQWSTLSSPLRPQLMAAVGYFTEANGLKRRAAEYCLEPNEIDAFLRWSSIVPAEMTRDLYGDAIASTRPEVPLRDWFAEAGGGRSERGVDLVAWLEARYRLVDHLLVRTDRLSMAVGLEGRVPFLDHRVVELLSSVPVASKMQGFTGKKLLREAFAHLLPEKTVQRRKKPFATPVSTWIESAAARYLSDSRLVADGILRAPAIDRILACKHTDRRRYENQAWLLVALEAWYRGFVSNGRGSSIEMADRAALVH